MRKNHFNVCCAITFNSFASPFAFFHLILKFLKLDNADNYRQINAEVTN